MEREIYPQPHSSLKMHMEPLGKLKQNHLFNISFNFVTLLTSETTNLMIPSGHFSEHLGLNP